MWFLSLIILMQPSIGPNVQIKRNILCLSWLGATSTVHGFRVLHKGFVLLCDDVSKNVLGEPGKSNIPFFGFDHATVLVYISAARIDQ